MTTSQQLMTAEDLWKLPKDGKRHELVRGEIRTMAPAGFEHGSIGIRMATLLANHVGQRKLGIVVGPDTGFTLSHDPDVVRSPDVAFVSQSQIRQVGVPKQYFPGAPDLAVEVLSPGDTVDDVEEKVNDLLAAGTKLVWVVNPRRRTVTVYYPGPRIAVLREGDQLQGEDVIPGFACGVGDLFSKE